MSRLSPRRSTLLRITSRRPALSRIIPRWPQVWSRRARGLSRRPDPARPRRERGAIASLVAILLSGGVLLGAGALVVDVGLFLAEREQLQTGADAGAVAVAKLCVGRNAECTAAAARAIADDYADDNSPDNRAAVAVCGQVPVTGVDPSDQINPCGTPPTNLTACQGPRPTDPAVPYVEVRTTTRVPGGTVLPPTFAGAITDTDGVRVSACTRITWGSVTQTSADLSMMVSRARFNAGTADGEVFQPAPATAGSHHPGVDQSREVALRWRPGAITAPDGFMWIVPHGTDPNCPHRLEVPTLERGATARQVPAGCSSVLTAVRNQRRPVAVAVYDDAAGLSVTTAGIAMFVVTGWRTPAAAEDWTGGPDSRRSTLSGRHLCPASVTTFCLYGYFTTKVFRIGTGAYTADHFGATYVRTIG